MTLTSLAAGGAATSPLYLPIYPPYLPISHVARSGRRRGRAIDERTQGSEAMDLVRVRVRVRIRVEVRVGVRDRFRGRVRVPGCRGEARRGTRPIAPTPALGVG